MEDKSEWLGRIVQEANVLARPLKITGGNTKKFLGCQPHGERVDVREHAGILNYEPTELVLTVRAGTLIVDVEESLRESGQFLPFEPPNFQSDATVGGTVASGLSGPSRPYRGAVRDFVLGVTCINGRGELLKFGGQVIKNVAGYDVSRLMVGAMGTLGIILDVSFKVLPLPETEQTRLYEVSEEVAISKMNEWAAKPLPISAACYLNKQLRIRLSGTGDGVEASARELGGIEDGDGRQFWQELREQQLSFFEKDEVLWRLVVPPSTPPLDFPGRTLIDWGGAQRWLLSSQNDHEIHSLIESVGGHASRFRGGDRSSNVFHPLSPEVAMLHRNLKKAFDPIGILNPGRLYIGI
uniref:FAD/FMN-containing dehydrogenases n=1 Tax=uncultured gamma proteobacterium HF0200_24F15 TaxID=723570 RepID=E7C3Z9_9GAMM|nr:FAD/FMN-containing dehydrogenases [uncultured gamma proteobacterium HF0200_24F15]